MPPIVLMLLKNKLTYFVLAIVAIIAFYNIKIIGMESAYNTKVSEYNKLDKRYTTLKGSHNQLKIDLKSTIKTNNENIQKISQYEVDNRKLRESYNLIANSKNKEIASLIKTIKSLRELPPVKYDQNDTITVQDCKVQITDGRTEYEIEKLNAISRIGR